MSTILSCNCVHRGSQQRENKEEGSRRKKKNQKAVSVSPILSFVVIVIIKTPDRIWFIPTVHKATVGLSAEGYQSIFSNHLILPASNQRNSTSLKFPRLREQASTDLNQLQSVVWEDKRGTQRRQSAVKGFRVSSAHQASEGNPFGFRLTKSECGGERAGP